MNFKDMNLTLPFPDVFPETWSEIIDDKYFVCFRNLDHFRAVVSELHQKKDDNCGMTYAEATRKLMLGESDFPETEQASIRNLVRSNLHKRGLISEEVYEEYKYDVNGTTVGVDIGKYVAGDPDCVITPTRQYIDFFHELYISVSYPHHVKNEAVRKNVAKLLATVEELERQHIYIKITLVFPARDVVYSKEGVPSNFFSAIPLFSHKDHKTVNIMSSIVNERLLRKFYFAVLEDLYGKALDSGYGTATSLPGSMNIGEEFDEISFFEDIVETVGA